MWVAFYSTYNVLLLFVCMFHSVHSISAHITIMSDQCSDGCEGRARDEQCSYEFL